MAIRIPADTDRPCPAFGVGCGGFLDADGVCTTCGAVVRQDRAAQIVAAIDEIVDELFDEPEWHGGYTDADLDVLADEAADRYYGGR